MRGDQGRMQARVLAALGGIVEEVAEARHAAKRSEWLVVRAHDVDAAAACPRQTASTMPEPFEDRPALAARMAALDTLRCAPADPAGPSAVVKGSWRAMAPEDGWPWTWLRGADGA